MASENEELQACKTAAQSALAQIMAYLEPICRTLQAEAADDEVAHPAGEGPQAGHWPLQALCLLRDSGYLEGLRLKALGALSGDLLDLIQELALSFEVAVRFDSALKLPFVGAVLRLECKSMSPWRVEAFRLFHGGLLSAYALQPLHLALADPPTPLEATLVVREGEEPHLHRPEALSRETVHSANNLLTGILNYAAILLKEPAQAPEHLEKIGLIQEAARKLALKLVPGPHPTPTS